jgi:transcriptional antiterminator
MYYQHIYQLIQLIELQLTGSPDEIAKKLGVSERTVYNYLSLLQKVFFVELVFSRRKQSYCFAKQGRLNWRWQAAESFSTDKFSIAHERFEILRRLLMAIADQETGPPSILANHLQISVRSLHNYIDLLKGEFRVPISYDRTQESYYFTSMGSLYFCWIEE